MNLHRISKICILIVTGLIISSHCAVAEGIKQRMKLRLPAIAALKTQGIIGENNKGYLGFVTNVKKSENVITAENQDRKMVYSYFAKQQNTDLGVVEKIQAERKAQKTHKGEFYQNSAEKWVRK